ncbi:MAG: DUF4131 domain-containing protein, partial [Candidatus Puniceispirillales bacterium]
MNDSRKTASNPLPQNPPPRKRLPRQWSLTAVTILIIGLAIGQTFPHAVETGGLIMLAGLMTLPAWRWIALMPGVTLGMIFLGLAIIHGSQPFAEKPPPEPTGRIDATGTVTMAEAMTRGRQRLRFTPDEGVGADWRLILPRRFVPVEPGDRLAINARLEPPLPQLLPGGFDFTAHAR